MRQLGIRLANAALFVVCCYAAAGVFNKISSAMLAPSVAPVSLETSEAPKPTVRSASRTGDINRRNLFGAKVKGQSSAPEPDPEPVATLTKLPLMLIGTAAFDSDPSLSRATISKQGAKSPEVVGVGDTLESYPGVTVEAISRRQVTLDNAGNREVLRLDDEPLVAKRSAVSKRKPKRATRSARDRSRRGKKTSSRGKSKLMDKFQKLANQNTRESSVATLLAQAQIQPKYDKNKVMVGIELSAIESGSLYEQIGLKDGDVIEELMGTKIDSPAASEAVIASLSSVDIPEIWGVVNGRPFKVPPEKVQELMQTYGIQQ